jgi:glycine dehydrogenase subunit 2
MAENKDIKTIFELSNDCPLSNKRIPEIKYSNKKILDLIPENLLEPDHGFSCDEDLLLPEISEIDLVRHYITLSNRNFGVDNGFYPLGSCTMKYNPKINEFVSNLNNFKNQHPYQPNCQGSLELIYRLENLLCELAGMNGFTLQPAAGAHGEFTGISIMKKYFETKGLTKKSIIIPDSAHGTNPATSAMCGYSVIVLNSTKDGKVNLNELRFAMEQGDVAGIMLTNPNTLGLFESEILEITKIVHENGGLCYYDGANMNALMGKCRPGDMGFDIVHLNLHKTFSTPHGGGGPGSGPVGVKTNLIDYLSNPRIIKDGEKYKLDNKSNNSIGKVKAFYGNFGVLVKAFTYIIMLGKDGLTRASENAVLNANYLRVKLSKIFNIPFDTICKHEFVLNDKNLPNDITTMDIAKRLLDYGVHAPTIYFPLIVEGAMMIEPTETESKLTLDGFIEVMEKIRSEIDENSTLLKNAPQRTPVGRLDDTLAARKPVLKFTRNRV